MYILDGRSRQRTTKRKLIACFEFSERGQNNVPERNNDNSIGPVVNVEYSTVGPSAPWAVLRRGYPNIFKK